MARYKTFVATGIAPDGRLYAGDLNGIQDMYVPLSDFTTVLDVGTLRVGDPTLQLLKYGAGEFRMSGSLRIDGILRGLSGIVAGAYTTAQRDAIPAGSRPYGLVILNTTNNRYEFNAGTDSTPSWQPLGSGATPGAHAATHAPGASDKLDYTLVNMRGTLAARPAANANNAGLLYFAYDDNDGTMYRSTGSAWEKAGSPVTPPLPPSNVPTAAIIPYGASFLPAGGWLFCDGAAVSRTAYATLFSYIGGWYGAGDGSTTFNVPDLRGRVPVGKGQKPDVAQLGYNDGLTVAKRNIKHTHFMWNKGTPGGSEETGFWYDITAGGRIIEGSDNDNVNRPAYQVINFIIKT